MKVERIDQWLKDEAFIITVEGMAHWSKGVESLPQIKILKPYACTTWWCKLLIIWSDRILSLKYGLRHWVAKIYKLKIQNLLQRINSFGIKQAEFHHSCILSPLAPDPIRVQSCVCRLFWTNRNSLGVASVFLSISLSNQRYESFNRCYQ